ncbi:hypothetical protein KKH13_04295 [Patescibacteria group bacterium]|nr:hypothetical protein [Patescibacteria group bacterium]
MADDPLAGRFQVGEAPPVEPQEPAVGNEPTEPIEPIEPQEPVVSPQEPVDAKGVPYKNRIAEAERKREKAEKAAEDLRKQLGQSQEQFEQVQTRLAVLEKGNAVEPAQAAAPASGVSFDTEALRRTPVEQWPVEALLQLKQEDKNWGIRVDAILYDRQVERTAQHVEQRQTLRQRNERIDAEIVALYPEMKDKTSSIYKEAINVTMEWGVNIMERPEALRGIVREAADRLGQAPAAPRRPVNLSPDGSGDPIPPRRVATATRPLTPAEQNMAARMGIDPIAYALELQHTTNEPLIGRDI